MALFGGALLTRDPIKRIFKLSDTKRQPNNKEETPDDPNRRWGFLIDLAKCNGCIDQAVPEDDPPLSVGHIDGVVDVYENAA